MGARFRELKKSTGRCSEEGKAGRVRSGAGRWSEAAGSLPRVLSRDSLKHISGGPSVGNRRRGRETSHLDVSGMHFRGDERWT